MHWVQATSRNASSNSTARFGHTSAVVDSSVVWGTELVVIYGGVSSLNGSDSVDQHVALSDVLVLQTETDTWFTPQCHSSSNPEARAFHASAVIDRKVYVFGGHVLSYEHEHNKKRRHFFNDLWCLDTVSGPSNTKLCLIWSSCNLCSLIPSRDVCHMSRHAAAWGADACTLCG